MVKHKRQTQIVSSEDNEKMLDVIEGVEISDLVEQYYKIEEKIIDKLSKLKNWSKECDCQYLDEVISIVHNNGVHNNGGIMKYCLNCGGYLED